MNYALKKKIKKKILETFSSKRNRKNCYAYMLVLPLPYLASCSNQFLFVCFLVPLKMGGNQSEIMRFILNRVWYSRGLEGTVILHVSGTTRQTGYRGI